MGGGYYVVGEMNATALKKLHFILTHSGDNCFQLQEEKEWEVRGNKSSEIFRLKNEISTSITRVNS